MHQRHYRITLTGHSSQHWMQLTTCLGTWSLEYPTIETIWREATGQQPTGRWLPITLACTSSNLILYFPWLLAHLTNTTKSLVFIYFWHRSNFHLFSTIAVGRPIITVSQIQKILQDEETKTNRGPVITKWGYLGMYWSPTYYHTYDRQEPLNGWRS